MKDTALEATLREIFGGRLQVSPVERERHGRDEAHLPPRLPDAVVYPERLEEVVGIVRACAERRCPVIPFGIGTSLEGHVIPGEGGVSVDLSRMADILVVHPEDLDVVVQPGVTRKQLDTHLRDSGLFFPVDPGADATLGGMAATRASGTNAVRYGTMRENVISLQAVLADGRVIRAGRRTRKSASGYDLRSLLVGSEGTLGIITELTLRLHGRPEQVAAGLCGFNRLESAVDAVIMAIQSGLPVARIELLDALQMRGVNQYSRLDYPEVPTLFVEFHGTDAGVREQSERFGEIAAMCEGGEFTWATATEDRNRLWRARHDAFYAAKALRPGAEGYVTDACVPISRLADCVRETQRDLEKSNLLAPLVGHAGDGNFHLTILIDPANDEEREEAARLADRLAIRAIEMNGTATGEHGVGLGKRKHMAAEHGEAWQVMGEIKRALDPLNIMNPGKIVPEWQ